MKNRKSFTVSKLAFAISMAFASYAHAQTATTVEYGDDEWVVGNHNGGMFVSKAKNDKAQVYILRSGYAAQPTPKNSAVAIAKVGTQDYPYWIGSDTSKYALYVSGSSIYQIKPSMIYSKDGATVDQLKFDTAAVAAHPLTAFPGIETATKILSMPSTTLSLIWLNGTTLMTSGGSFSSPSSTILDTGVTDVKSFAGAIFYVKADGVYQVKGAGGSQSEKVPGETDLAFLRDDKKMQAIEAENIIHILSNGSFEIRSTANGVVSTGKQIKSIAKTSGDIVYLGNDNKYYYTNFNNPWVTYPLPSSFDGNNVKEVLGITTTNVSQFSTSYPKIGSGLIIYIDNNDKLVIDVYNGSGANLTSTWILDAAKRYTSPVSFQVNRSGYVKFDNFGKSIDGFSLTSGSPLAGAWASGKTPEEVISMGYRGYIFISGNGAFRVMYDHDTSNWVTEGLPTAQGAFFGFDSDDTWLYLDPSGNVVVPSYSVVGNNTIEIYNETTSILNKNTYDSYAAQVRSGTNPYSGSTRAGQPMVAKANGGLVASTFSGQAGNLAIEPYHAINQSDWRQTTATMPATVDAPFAADTGAKGLHTGNGDAILGLLPSGVLKFYGGLGVDSTSKVNIAGTPNATWGSDAAIEVPLDSSVAPTGVKATKGKFNDRIAVTWIGSGTKTTYSVQAGYGALYGTVATGLTSPEYIDTNTSGGSGPASPTNYKIFSTSTHDVYKNRNNVAKLTIAAVPTGGGCQFTDPYTKECSGWRANAPTGLTITPITMESNSQAKAFTAFTIADIDQPYDKFTLSVKTAPTNGSAELRADGLIYYSPAPNYAGSDSFLIEVTDQAGNKTTGTANVTVTCPAPVLASITVPQPFAGLTSQMTTVDYSANACNGTVKVTYKLVDMGTLLDVPGYTFTRTGQNNGANQKIGFTLNDMPPGKYRIDATVDAENPAVAATNKSSLNRVFDVNGFGEFTLNMDKMIYTEDDLIIASVTGSSGSCPIVDELTARNDGKCYVTWPGIPLQDFSKKSDSSVQGYGTSGSDYTVVAEIHKYDSHLNSNKIGTLNKTISVLPGTPTSLKPVTFAKPFVRWMDRIQFSFERASGFSCKFYMDLAEATAAAGTGARACYLETTLPAGFNWVTSASFPTVTGRADTWSAGTPNVTMPYKLHKVYVSKAPYLMTEGTITVPVVDFSLTPNTKLDRLSYAANSSVVNAQAETLSKLPANATVCGFTTVEAEAQTSYATGTTLSCLVEWDTIPPGLAIVPGTTPKLSGVPNVIGDNPIGFSVYVAKPNGAGFVREKIAQYTGVVKVTDLVPLSYTMLTPTAGTITLAGDTNPRILVGDDGKLGEIQINGGDFSKIKMSIVEPGSAPQTFLGLLNGNKQVIAISGGTKGAWISRQAELKLEYEEITTPSQQSFILDAVQLPASKVVTIAVPPIINPNDTDPFSLQTAVGFSSTAKQLQYNAARDGNWNMAIFAKQGQAMVPMTAYAEPDVLTGVATFDNLTYSSFVGQELYSVATWIPPAGATLSIPEKKLVSPSGMKLTFVMGGSIQGTTTVGRTQGPAPLKQTFDVKLTTEAAAALKSVIWYYSDDNMQTWKPAGVIGRAASYTFVKGGVYYVRGEMTNKYTNVVSYSTPVAFSVVENLNVTAVSDEIFLPGSIVPIVLSATAKDGSPIAEYDTRWEVINSTGAVQQYTDIYNLDLTSSVPDTFLVNIMAKSKTMDAANPASWTTISKKIFFFAPSKPKVLITGPRVIEVGKTGTLVAKITKPWDSKAKTSLTIGSKWILPNGTEVTTEALEFSPVAEDGLVQKVKHVAWVNGLEAETSVTTEYSVSISSYIFPNFIYKAQLDTVYAPAYIRLSAIPATAFDQTQSRGKKLTYTWTVPNGITGTATGSMLRGTIDMPGTYDINLVVSDDRGNSQTMPYQITIESSRPWELTAGVVPGIKYNRAPMTYVLKPVLKGGHPKDKIETVALKIDGVNVYEAPVFPRSFVVPTAGSHTAEVTVNTIMGASVSATIDLVVNENQLPACTMGVTWDKTGTTARLQPACTDADGRINRIVWYQDGVKLNKTSTYLVVTLSPTLPNSTIVAEVYDDANGMVTLTENLILQ